MSLVHTSTAASIQITTKGVRLTVLMPFRPDLCMRKPKILLTLTRDEFKQGLKKFADDEKVLDDRMAVYTHTHTNTHTHSHTHLLTLRHAMNTNRA
jgi:hypothetical protein